MSVRELMECRGSRKALVACESWDHCLGLWGCSLIVICIAVSRFYERLHLMGIESVQN